MDAELPKSRTCSLRSLSRMPSGALALWWHGRPGSGGDGAEQGSVFPGAGPRGSRAAARC